MSFCNSCGATMTGTFCNKCGARAVGQNSQASIVSHPTPLPIQAVPPMPAQVPVAVQPVVAPTKSSAGKILLVIGGVLLVLFMIGAAAAAYGVYWVKHKVATYTSAATGGSETVKVVQNG